MVVSGIGVSRKGDRDSALINGTDLFATIAELAGLSAPKVHDSYSFAALISSHKERARDYIYSEILSTSAKSSGWTIRDDRYKLIEFDNGNQEFYDLTE